MSSQQIADDLLAMLRREGAETSRSSVITTSAVSSSGKLTSNFINIFQLYPLILWYNFKVSTMVLLA